MNSDNIISIISSVAILALGFFLRYTKEDEINYPNSTLKSIQKFWILFVIGGILSLFYGLYKIIS